MNSTLPSRWQEILRREAAENVGNVLAQAKDQPDPRRVAPLDGASARRGPGFRLAAQHRSEGPRPPGKGSVPFDRSTVISTRTAGLGASAEDLAPRREPSRRADASWSSPRRRPPATHCRSSAEPRRA